MAVELASEEQMLLDVVRELVRDKVAPRAAELNGKRTPPARIALHCTRRPDA